MAEAVRGGFTRRGRQRRWSPPARRRGRSWRRMGHPPLQRQDGAAGHAGEVPGRHGRLDQVTAQATDALHGCPLRGRVRPQLRWRAHRIVPRPASAGLPPQSLTGDRVIAGCSDHLGRSVALRNQRPPARGPHRHAAGDVDRLPALRVQVRRHPGRPATRPADDIHRVAVGHLVKSLGQGGHGHVDGARRMSGGPFVVFPDIEQHGVGRYLGDGHFRDLGGTHPAILPPTVTGTPPARRRAPPAARAQLHRSVNTADANRKATSARMTRALSAIRAPAYPYRRPAKE